MPFDGTEKIVVGFAGGGGSCQGIRQALGRDPDVAINHDAGAIAMHAVNFPTTRHYLTNIWRVDPSDVRRDLGGAPLGLSWFSPDCKHFSKAKGGKPRDKSIRDLAWIVPLWAKRYPPRVIAVENVEEFQDWGPLLEDGQPCPVQRGFTFKAWVRELQRHGYKVDWRELRGCDYGAPTIRKRLFVVARNDGLPIVFPTPTHGPGLMPFRTAADCIDWSIPCPSIFLTREEGRALGVNRPLAENTMARIAKGVWRFVLNAAEPFIVPVTHTVDQRAHPISDPLRTITCASRGEMALVTPFLVPRYGERPGQEPRALDVDAPMPTIVPTANGGSLVAAHLTKFHTGQVGGDIRDPLPTITANSYVARPGGAPPLGVVAAFLAQHNTDMVGHAMGEPVSTIVGKGCTQGLIAAHLLNMKGTDRSAWPIDGPSPTQCAGGWHIAEVAAFLIKYYGAADHGQAVDEPLHTATDHARFGLVVVKGEFYRIVDIGMRMLTPRELFRAQGFPDSYVIDHDADGNRFTKTARIARVGNSVCPDVAAAIVRANYYPATQAMAV